MDALFTGVAKYECGRQILNNSGLSRPSKRSRSDDSLFHMAAEMQRESPIESLPEECLFEILRRLDGAERSNCASVSKRWLTLLCSIRSNEIHRIAPLQADVDAGIVPAPQGQVENEGFLTRSLEDEKATDVRLAAIAVCIPSRGGLRKISIRGSHPTRGVTDFGMWAIARASPSLKFLQLWNVKSVTDRGLRQMAMECKKLRTLDFFQCLAITDKGLIAIADNCPDLTNLSIDSCPYVGSGSLQAFARCCPRLKYISIKDCRAVGDQGVASLLTCASSSFLTSIILAGVCITDYTLAVIGHYGKSITYLSLSDLTYVTEKGFWAMGCAQRLKALASLSVDLCSGITDRTLEVIGKACPILKNFHISRCALASNIGLVSFCKWAGCLESLHIEECDSITQLGLTCALSVCSVNMKHLTVVRCPGVMDMSQCVDYMFNPRRSLQALTIKHSPGFSSICLAIIGKMCPTIRYLDLTGLYTITNDGLLTLLQSCNTGLVEVNLSGCFKLTDSIVMLIARLHGRTINVLNLSGCRKITDASLLTIADNCLLLNSLDVSGCAVTDAGIAALSCAAYMNLQFLGLSECSRLSNKCLPFLLKLGNSLEGLTLHMCNSISRKKILLLMEKLWKCDILA